MLAMGAVAFGAAAWLLLGPVWTAAGALAGSLVTFVVVAGVRAFTSPDAATLLNNDQPDEAIARLRNEIPSWRTLARIWPSQFRDALANRLIVQSGALQAMNRDEEALRTADEAVAIYQDLAAERPGKYGPDLADALDHQSRLLAADDRLAEALTAMQVAVRLYRNLASAEPARYLPTARRVPDLRGGLASRDRAVRRRAGRRPRGHRHLPGQAALAAASVLRGPGHAAGGRAPVRTGPLPRGGPPAGQGLAHGRRQHVHAGQHLQDELRDATPAIRAAYRADPDHFAAVWHAETGAEPPDWLTE